MMISSKLQVVKSGNDIDGMKINQKFNLITVLLAISVLMALILLAQAEASDDLSM